jgi:hypothetical protein
MNEGQRLASIGLAWSGVHLNGIFRLALAADMATFAINVRSLFHSLTLSAAILSRRDFAGTDRMRAFPALAGCHMWLPSSDRDKNFYFRPTDIVHFRA